MGVGYGKKKETGPREWYANWGGYGADPELDPELFARLPAHIQQYKLELKRIVKEHPEARAFEIHDPSTGKPYPGQVLIRDLMKQAEEAKQALPEVPDWYKFEVPNAVPVAIFSLTAVGCKWTPEQVADVLSRLEKQVTQEALVANCISGRGLSPAKPVDGLFAFVWRVARFNTGLDTFIPVTAFIDLEDGLGRLGIAMPDEESLKPVIRWLQDRADVLVERSGGDKHAAAERYGRAVGLLR